MSTVAFATTARTLNLTERLRKLCGRVDRLPIDIDVGVGFTKVYLVVRNPKLFQLIERDLGDVLENHSDVSWSPGTTLVVSKMPGG